MEGGKTAEGNCTIGLYKVLRSNINVIILNIGIFWGTWVAQLVAHLPSAQIMIPGL